MEAYWRIIGRQELRPELRGHVAFYLGSVSRARTAQSSMFGRADISPKYRKYLKEMKKVVMELASEGYSGTMYVGLSHEGWERSKEAIQGLRFCKQNMLEIFRRFDEVLLLPSSRAHEELSRNFSALSASS